MALPGGRVTNDPANYFAIGQQSAKDVSPTVWYFTKHLDGTGFDVNIDVSSEREGGAGREVGLRYRTKVTADGSFVQYARPDFLGRVFALALGQDTVTAGPSQGTGNPYYSTHYLASGQSQIPYFSAAQQWADEVETVTNGLVSSLKLEGQAGHPVKTTVQFVTGGTPVGQQAALVPTRESSFPIMVPGGSVAIVTNPYNAGSIGASSLQITKWTFEIKNQLDDNIQTVQLQREDVLWLNADYDVEGTFKYINDAFWNQITYGGGSTVPTGLLNNGQFFFYSQTPSAQSAQVFLPFIEFPAMKVNRLDPDGKTMYIDFTASTRNIGTQSVQATIISGASTSYALSTT